MTPYKQRRSAWFKQCTCPNGCVRSTSQRVRVLHVSQWVRAGARPRGCACTIPYVSQWVRAKHVPKGARTTRVPAGACRSMSQRVRVYCTLRIKHIENHLNRFCEDVSSEIAICEPRRLKTSSPSIAQLFESTRASRHPLSPRRRVRNARSPPQTPPS